MVKYLLNSLFIFLMLSSFALAKIDREETKLKQEFGQDLTAHVPFFLRYSFSKQYGKDWSESDYGERKDFLTKYDINLTAEQKQEKADAKAQADKERDRLREKRKEQRELEAKLRAEQAEERATKRYYEERQRNFDKMIKDEQRELAGMEQQTQQQQLQQQQQEQQQGQK